MQKSKLLIVLTMLIIPTTSYATDFTQKILDANNQPIKQENRDLTLGDVSSAALFANRPDDKASSEDKFKRGILALKLKDAKGDIVLSSEEITLIKDQIGKSFSPLIVVRAWQMLDLGVQTNPSVQTKSGEVK